jgi:hypothetical protein
MTSGFNYNMIWSNTSIYHNTFECDTLITWKHNTYCSGHVVYVDAFHSWKTCQLKDFKFHNFELYKNMYYLTQFRELELSAGKVNFFGHNVCITYRNVNVWIRTTSSSFNISVLPRCPTHGSSNEYKLMWQCTVLKQRKRISLNINRNIPRIKYFSIDIIICMCVCMYVRS